MHTHNLQFGVVGVVRCVGLKQGAVDMFFYHHEVAFKKHATEIGKIVGLRILY